MRGRPAFELFLVCVLGILLGFPLHRLTRPRTQLSASAVPAEVVSMDDIRPVWLDLRFSHPPEQFAVYQGDILLGKGGEDLRWDEDADLRFEDQAVRLRITGTFPEELDSVYLELTVEPEQQAMQRGGLWTRGSFSHVMEFRWPEN